MALRLQVSPLLNRSDGKPGSPKDLLVLVLGMLLGSGVLWNYAKLRIDKKQLECNRATQTAQLYKEQSAIYQDLSARTQALYELGRRVMANADSVATKPEELLRNEAIDFQQANTAYDLLVDRFYAIEQQLCSIEGREPRDFAIDGRPPHQPDAPKLTGRVLIEGKVVYPYPVVLKRQHIVVLRSCNVSLRVDVVHPDSTVDITWIEKSGRTRRIPQLYIGFPFTGRPGPHFFYAVVVGADPKKQEVRLIVYQEPSSSGIEVFDFEWYTLADIRNATKVQRDTATAWLPLPARDLSIPLYIDRQCDSLRSKSASAPSSMR